MKVRAGVFFELDPTSEQRQLLVSFAGTARFVWNWGLERSQQHYEEVVKPAREKDEKVRRLSGFDLINEWNLVKKTVAPWHVEVASAVPTQALLNLDMASARFFADLSKNGRRSGYPCFKTRGRCRESFRVQAQDVSIKSMLIRLPRIGWIKLKQDPTARLSGCRVTSVTMSEHAGWWYASCAVEREIEDLAPVIQRSSVLSIDLGIKTFAVLSDSRQIEAPQPLQKNLGQLRRLSRDIARQRNVREGVKTRRMKKREAHLAAQAGERYWPTKAVHKEQIAVEKAVKAAKLAEQKADLARQQASAKAAGQPIPRRLRDERSRRQLKREKQLARLHRTVANRRSNFLHQTTTNLVRWARKHGTTIAVENLRTSNLLKNHRLARRIADQGWREFRRQLEYKTLWQGVGLYLAPANFASSKTCSSCGITKAQLDLSECTYSCAGCGLFLDRDLNAARNLQKQAGMALARGESVRPGYAGQDSANRRLAPRRRPQPEQILSDTTQAAA